MRDSILKVCKHDILQIALGISPDSQISCSRGQRWTV